MSSTSDLLQRVQNAMVEGQHRPPPPPDESPLAEFSELLEASIGGQMPAEEWATITSSARRYKQPLLAAQRGDLAEADRLARQAWDRLDLESLSPVGRLLVEVFHAPCDAYLMYKRERYEEARALILEISTIDRRLVTEFGFQLLSAHRLQLGHNLLRIHTRLVENRVAIRLGSEFLDHLEFRVEPATNELLCPRTVLDSVPQSVVEYYFDKICAELAIVLAGSNDHAAAELFQPLIRHADHTSCREFAPHAHAWARMKQLALDGETGLFLEAAIDLLRSGRRSEHQLWYATILDVVGVSRSFGPEGIRFADRIATEAAALPDAPWAMRQATGTRNRTRRASTR